MSPLRTPALNWAKTAALAALLPMMSATAWAAEVDEVRAADPDARIEFSGVTGEFTFVGSSSNQLEIEGTLGDEVDELVIEGDASSWEIRLEMKESTSYGWSWNRKPQTSLVIRVPEGSDLNASAVSADLAIEGLRGPRLVAETVSGDLTISKSSPARLSVESVSGDIEVDGGGVESTNLQAVSGDIEAFGLAGRINVEAVSGDLDIDAIEVSEFDAQTVSGDLEARLQPTARAQIDVQTHSGGIDLTLPAGTPVDVDAETFSGDLENYFAGDTETMREKGMSVRAGDGSVRVRAQTFSGEFVLRESDR